MPTIDTTLRDALCDAVDARRDALADELLQLVRVPSVTGNEGPVQDVVERLFRDRGLTIDRWEATPDEIAPYLGHVGEQSGYAGRPNIVGRREGIGGGCSILLNAHVDTVDPGERAAWSHDPAGEMVDGRIYGRGACDMKGGLVTHLAALDALDAAGVQLQGDVTVAATVGEENGGLGALSTVLRGYGADAALITEPTKLALVPAQGGSLVFRLTVPGRSAHGAVRDRGVSALEKFLPLHAELLAMERERNEAFQHPLYAHLSNKMPISVGVVHAGVWPSTVPESLVAEGRLGFAPGEEIDDIQALAEARLAAVAARDPWLRDHPPRIEWFGGQFASAEVPLDDPLCEAVRAAHGAATGASVAVEGVPYGADMRLFTRFGGMPCVMYGAGDVNVCHAPDEFIPLDDLVTAAKTLAILLANWCGMMKPQT